jgi:hypothetical protein
MFAVLDAGRKHETFRREWYQAFLRYFLLTVQHIGNYAIADLINMYRKYKRLKHILL